MEELETKKRGPKLKKWLPWLVVAVLALAVIGLWQSARSARGRQTELESELKLQRETIAAMQEEQERKEEPAPVHKSEPVITSSLVSGQIGSLQQLVTAEYIYTNSGKYENQKQITVIGQNLNIPFTNSYFIVAYDGRIKVGVDLSKVTIDVNDVARTVTVTLPKSEIISHETFEDSLVVLDEISNVFNPISISDYNEFVNAQSDRMEKKAKEYGIFTRASDEAKSLVQSALTVLPGIGTGEGEYRLIVK